MIDKDVLAVYVKKHYTDMEKIEQYVRCLLESWALSEEGDERVVWLTLHDLLMAVSRFELMPCWCAPGARLRCCWICSPPAGC